jgi:subtilisin family serine protease
MSKTTLFLIGLCLFLLSGTILADQTSKIHPWVLTNTAAGQQAEFFIVLQDRADLSPAFQMSRKIDRGTFVYRTLFDTAQRSQAPIKDWLQARGIKYQSFYIINALLITAGRDIVDQLAARDDVDRIEGNPVIHNKIPEPITPVSPESPEAIEWNIIKTKAPDMWNLGFTGAGIVVGGADTGYRWTHNALKGKYRGWDGANADHDYNWHDSIHSGGGSCGANSAVPCDDNGHGTHTMGTVLGDDGGSNQIGMAPGAKWIGCRNMNQGNGTPATYIECFEFFLAPYPIGGNPSQGDPAFAPDVTSNSWSCPPSEGCSPTSLQAAVDAQKAAGIMTVAAAQNSGPSCGTVNDPIGIYGSAYTVGSTTNTPNNLLSGFSSRGPADSTNLTKPNIVAPGSSVRSASSSSDGGYTTLSGTSMATPNVAGGIAIVWSALPAYKNDQDATETLLNGSALRLPHIVEACGGDYVNGPNNSWGNGLMDVLAAYNAACTPPAAPQNLASSLTVDNVVSLTWDPVPFGGGTTYQVFRGSGACPGSGFTQIGTPSVNSFLDSNVSGGNTYSYMVKAVDVCASAFSNCTDETIPCAYDVTPDNATIAGAGGTDSFDVTTGSGCNWSAVSNDSWIHITAGDGTGNGTVDYSVDANPDTISRSGTITLATETFTVNQDPGSTPCLFCDDFEDGIPPANWLFKSASAWNETGGSLVGTPGGRKALAVATPAFAGGFNITVQAQMQTAGGPRNILWLLGWFVDKKNTMELLMKQQSGKWILKQRSAGRVVAKIKGSSPIAVGTTYNISLSFNGTQFQLTVDSVPVLSLTPVGTVPTGTVGFQVKNTTGSFGEISVN